jgi:hypothetical protein
MTSMSDFPDATPGSPDPSRSAVDLSEAARQLELVVHDAQVAFDCIGLGNLDRAHTHAITARTAADAAENILRAALNSGLPRTG